MAQSFQSFRTILLWISAGALAALIFPALAGSEGELTERAGFLNRGADARLVSYQALPEMQEEFCVWMPAGGLMAATLRQDPSVMTGLPAAGPRNRDPLRIIRDPYPSLSSVAVDLLHNEVVATDENLFQIMVFNRLDNTPVAAAMTEPKRILTGRKTSIYFQCGLYVDPRNSDIYAVNNDTEDKLVIFSREAEGNVPPDRWLHTPHGTFGIAMDEEHQELFLTVQHDSAVVVYSKTASEEEAPIRLLQGDRTRLADPHGIALDTKNDLMFVANFGSVHSVPERTEIEQNVGEENGLKPNWPLGRGLAIPGSGRILPPAITVYPRTAIGDTPPLRVIEGAKTQFNWPTGLAFDSERGELFVSNDMGHSILVFRGDASGNAAPIRVLKGPRTGIRNPTGIYLDTKNGELWVSNFGGHSLTVYPLTADGDTPPLRTIRTAPIGQPSLMIGNPGAVAYDSKREEILVPN